MNPRVHDTPRAVATNQDANLSATKAIAELPPTPVELVFQAAVSGTQTAASQTAAFVASSRSQSPDRVNRQQFAKEATCEVIHTVLLASIVTSVLLPFDTLIFRVQAGPQHTFAFNPIKAVGVWCTGVKIGLGKSALAQKREQLTDAVGGREVNGKVSVSSAAKTAAVMGTIDTAINSHWAVKRQLGFREMTEGPENIPKADGLLEKAKLARRGAEFRVFRASVASFGLLTTPIFAAHIVKVIHGDKVVTNTPYVALVTGCNGVAVGLAGNAADVANQYAIRKTDSKTLSGPTYGSVLRSLAKEEGRKAFLRGSASSALGGVCALAVVRAVDEQLVQQMPSVEESVARMFSASSRAALSYRRGDQETDADHERRMTVTSCF